VSYDLKDVVKPSLEYLTKFKEFLQTDVIPVQINTQYGRQITPVGLHKLKIIEWIHSLIYLKEDRICQKFQEIDLAKSLLALMKKYEMNSLLHLRIFNVFNEAVTVDSDLWADTVLLLFIYVNRYDSSQEIVI
jgi:hypothetical protein